MVARHLDDTVAGPAPDDAGDASRCGEGPEGPDGHGRIAGGLAYSGDGGSSRMRNGKIRTELGPGHAAVGGPHEVLIAGEQLAPAAPRRKGERQIDRGTQFERRVKLGPHVDPFAARIRDLRDAEPARV